MSDFLNNPDERIAEFNNSIEDRLQKKVVAKSEIAEKSKRKTSLSKKKSINNEVLNENNPSDTVQIRISRNIESELQRINWHIYQKTGRKSSMRELLDRALLEYIDNWKRMNS